MEATAEERLRPALEALDDLELLDLESAFEEAADDVEEATKTTGGELKLNPSMPKTRNAYYRELDTLTGKLEAGKITQVRFERDAGDMISKNFEQVYKDHRGLDVLTAGDEEYLNRAVADEMKYATQFGQDIVDDSLLMPRQQRAGMYSNTLNGIAQHAQVENLPDDVRLNWQLGDAEHCVDCLVISANSPFSKWNLPTTPRAGATVCLCITTPRSRVLTKRGAVPISKVVVGDYVLTHMGRWRRVLATHINDPELHHRQAWIETPTGRTVGCTADHPFMAAIGWQSLFNVDMLGLPVYATGHELQKVWKEDSVGHEDWGLSGVQVGLSDLWDAEGSPGGRVHFVRYETQGKTSVGGSILTRADSGRVALRWLAEETAIQRFVLGSFQFAQEGWQGLRVLLERFVQTLRVPLPVAVGVRQRTSSGWNGLASQERRLFRRPVGKSGNDVGSQARWYAHQGRLQSEMVGGCAGVDVLGVRNQVSHVAQGWAGQCKEILFSNVCQSSKGQEVSPTKLHDLTVEEDHSFIVEGLVCHNSNCRCKLVVVKGRLSRAEKEDAAAFGHRKDQSLTEMLGAPEPPKGLRAPSTKEQKYIDRLRSKINTNRRIVATETNPVKLKKAVAARRAANEELIDFLEKNDVYEVPVWSVDDVLDERHAGKRAVRDIFRHGLDGKSLDLVGKKKLGVMLARYEKLTGELLSDDAILKGLGGQV